jgi:hypothetical protein
MAFDVEHFRYNKENDTYSCPANEINHKRKWYNKTNGKSINQMKHYKTNSCMLCCFDQCTKTKGRLIERSQYADVIYQNKNESKQL